MAFHILPATGFRPGNNVIVFLLVLHCSENSDFFNLQAKIGASKASTIHRIYIFWTADIISWNYQTVFHNPLFITSGNNVSS